ncbi:MAG TPA: Asp-tRNA(Asn)/Glu-tRNA(Gln) amidotransferase subunit GatB [Firmicutes bacterium]|nr:Asp-tRNA(Asn)/Glu-tRNA(Gln) amidotransferase subunit GatB [Bacillota bacterium]
MGYPEYQVIIGLEIHAELATESKVFCSCPTTFGAAPNTQVCPICLALPGALPVLNEKAVELAVKAGLALGCEIPPFSRFDRKHYFYPDLPKAFQTSQLDHPLCRSGIVEFRVDDQTYQVRINRVHLEEEAGKSVHSGERLQGSHYSLMDLNRGGLPLIEIVTEPDLRSGEQAKAFLERLRTILRYIEVSDCKMQEGSLRCDANVNLSINDNGKNVRTSIVEIKNLNSFRAVERAINYEAQRQYEDYLDGNMSLNAGKITAGWSDAEGRTYVQRQKEQADDYFYFPDPDLVPIEISAEQVESWRSQLPELPAEREARFVTQYGLSAYDAGVLTAAKGIADFYETVVENFDGDPKIVANWVMGEVLRMLKDAGDEAEQALAEAPLKPHMLAELLQLLQSGAINGNQAKEVFAEMWTSGKDAAVVVKERGFEQISDTAAIAELVNAVIAANPKVIADIQGGKTSAMGFLVGQVMKKTAGKANPKLVNQLIREQLNIT